MTNNETREQRNPYRGNCLSLQAINEVPIDISVLVKENRPVNPDEPAKRFLPVMGQISWFKLRNGDKGTISTELIANTDLQAVVRAVICVDGQPISNAYGTANTIMESNENGGEYWIIETAERRAISRALNYAGYGCQLDLDYVDEDVPSNSSSSSPNPDATIERPSSHEETPSVPGTVSGKDVKLDANAASCIVDIHDLESDQGPAPDIQPAVTSSRRRVRKTKETENEATATGETLESGAALGSNSCLIKVDGKYLHIQRTDSGWDYTVYDVESKKQLDGGLLEDTGLSLSQAITSACEQQDIHSKNINAMPMQLLEELEAAQDPVQQPEQPAAEPEMQEDEQPGSPESLPYILQEDTAVQGNLFDMEDSNVPESAPAADGSKMTPEEQVMNYVQLALQGGYPDPILDPEFFGEGNQDPEAFFVNEGNRNTKMRNRDLQWAIDYLDSHKDLLLDVHYPAPSGDFAGKTYREIFAEYPKHIKTILGKAAMLYYGPNFPNYAALLLILKQMKLDEK